MSVLSERSSYWAGGEKTPEISSSSWNLLAVPAAVLVVMAILQIISFGSFRDWMEGIRLGGATAFAIIVIICELWGAASLLRIPMGASLRYIGIVLALLVTGFWFIENLYLATSSGGQLPNSGYFGKYLSQSPGWWTVIEASIMLFWLVFAAEAIKWRARR